MNPVEEILKEIEKALAANLHYLAIVMAVTLPDICAALESADGRSDTQRYKNWYDANMANYFGALTGDDLWSLRCGVVHQGRFGLAGAQYARVVFALPGSATFLNCIFNDAYFYSAEEFCRTAISAVREWITKKGEDPIVKANLPNLVRYHPNGLAPYAVGISADWMMNLLRRPIRFAHFSASRLDSPILSRFAWFP
jgi:hypothetical protein